MTHRVEKGPDVLPGDVGLVDVVGGTEHETGSAEGRDALLHLRPDLLGCAEAEGGLTAHRAPQGGPRAVGATDRRGVHVLRLERVDGVHADRAELTHDGLEPAVRVVEHAELRVDGAGRADDGGVEGDTEELNTFLDHVSGRPKFGFGGFSVTLPHKTHALHYANLHGDYVDNLAEAIGAVNTLKIGFNGLLSAYNTDYSGAMDALIAAMGVDRHDLHKTKVAVVGAGGVARAVVAGLADVGARVTIYNRTVSKAQSLAKEFGCKSASVDKLAETALPRRTH